MELLGYMAAGPSCACLCIPLAAMGLGFVYVAALCVLPVAIVLSAAAKLIASFLWPAHVLPGLTRSAQLPHAASSAQCPR